MHQLHLFEVGTLDDCKPQIIWAQSLEYDPVCIINVDTTEPTWLASHHARDLIQQYCADHRGSNTTADMGQYAGRYKSRELREQALTKIHCVQMRIISESKEYDVPVIEVLDSDEITVCPICKNELMTKFEGHQYWKNHPGYYDGISEWQCECGTRIGRWTGKVLGGGKWFDGSFIDDHKACLNNMAGTGMAGMEYEKKYGGLTEEEALQLKALRNATL